MCRLVLAALVAVLLPGAAAALPPPSAIEIGRLIKQLGADEFAKRDAAMKALGTLGERTLPALQKASRAAKDAELRRRAGQTAENVLDRFIAREQKRLAGTWLVVSADTGGGQIHPDKPWIYLYEGERIIWLREGKPGPVSTYKPGPGGTLELYANNQSPIKGIYRLDGDTLLWCFNPDGSGRPERPEVRKGSRTVLLTMKRQKPEPARPKP